jgi:hypothetical protein
MNWLKTKEALFQTLATKAHLLEDGFIESIILLMVGFYCNRRVQYKRKKVGFP